MMTGHRSNHNAQLLGPEGNDLTHQRRMTKVADHGSKPWRGFRMSRAKVLRFWLRDLIAQPEPQLTGS